MTVPFPAVLIVIGLFMPRFSLRFSFSRATLIHRCDQVFIAPEKYSDSHRRIGQQTQMPMNLSGITDTAKS